ncbi:MAG: hypothetical protein LCH41_06185 [Armatimonadetes bacterium]|nr:hypothetical protein [Armatimonadota bacterium]
MRQMRESGITFDFAEMKSVVRQDSKADGGHECWSGIDFRCVTATGEHLWIEIKNFDLSRFPPRFRGGKQREYVGKISSKSLAREIRDKFLGTAAYLGLTGTLERQPILYVAIVEPPRAVDKALLLGLSDQLAGFLQKRLPWTSPASLIVMSLDEWNKIYTEFPAEKD